MTARYLTLLLCAGCTEYDFHGDKSPEPPGEDGVPEISVSPSAIDLGIVGVGETGEGEDCEAGPADGSRRQLIKCGVRVCLLLRC